MLVNKDRFKLSLPELLMAVVSCIFCIGIRSWFAVCPVMSETVMSCHWAGEVLKAISILLLVCSLIHIFCPDFRLKAGMDIPFLGICILTVFIPGGIINLCMMEDMACRHAAKPWTVIVSIALIVLVIVDLILNMSRISKEKHGRGSAS